jgi:glycerol-3-phosphate O-acyltransferase / dihydroxyacetone phosphate acyltransferase
MDRLANFLGDVVRWLARKLVLLYYSRIYVTNRELVPDSGPVLFVANHANSLLDAVMVGRTARRPVHFLAKAPLFTIPVFGPALHALGMVPAYRARDDASQVLKNADSIAQTAACLVKGEAVGIFPEGKSHDQPAIEQVRTGAARIASQAISNGGEDLKIVPVGINYERKERFRSTVWVNVGPPIPAKVWLNGGEERKAVRELTGEIERRLKQVAVHLDEPSWEVVLEDLEALHPPPRESRDALSLLQQRKHIADAMNHFRAKGSAHAELVGDLLQNHHEGLEAAGLNIHSDFLHYRGILLVLRLLARGFMYALSFVLGIPGTLHHLLPFGVTRWLAGMLQAPGRSTIALSRLLIGIPVYAIWYFLVWKILADQFSREVAWIWTFWMPSAGLFALMFWRQTKRVAPVLGREMAMLIRPEQIGKLRANQEKLKVELAKLAAQYRQKKV